MLDYIFGKVSDVYPSYIVIETYGVGFKVNTPNPYSFELDSTIKVYLYNYIKEDEYSLYGFIKQFLISLNLFPSIPSSSGIT